MKLTGAFVRTKCYFPLLRARSADRQYGEYLGRPKPNNPEEQTDVLYKAEGVIFLRKLNNRPLTAALNYAAFTLSPFISTCIPAKSFIIRSRNSAREEALKKLLILSKFSPFSSISAIQAIGKSANYESSRFLGH